MKSIKLAKVLVGEGKRCFIIAEAGVNHNGSLDLAKKLVDVAKEAGVDAVKFQTAKTEDVVTASAGMAEYQKNNTGKIESQLKMLKRFELKEQDFLEIKKYCDSKGVLFLSTAHTESVIDFLNPLVPFHKIASGDITNFIFLEKIAKKRKPIILSTGMSYMKEVKEAVKVIKKYGNNKIIILHCTTNYPCPIGEVNLSAILSLKKELGLLVGYSDHTGGIEISVMAVAMGACVLEKHFTLDKNLPGPDHKASLEPKELKELVKKVREAEIIMGSCIKKPTKNEKEIKKIVRKSIVANADIKKGVFITDGMLIIKRPGTGINPKYFKNVVGKKTKVDIKKDQLINWKMV